MARQSSQESQQEYHESKDAEVASKENHGINLEEDKQENVSSNQEKYEGERFLSPIMEELSDVPSDFLNSTECQGVSEMLQTQSACPQKMPHISNTTSLPDSVKQEDHTIVEVEKDRRSNRDEEKLSLHSLLSNGIGASEHLTLADEHQVQLKRKITKETSCDPEKTPEPKRKVLSAECTFADQDGSNRSSHAQTQSDQTTKRITRKESEYLREGEQHCVWKPNFTRKFSHQQLITETKPPSAEAASKEVNTTKRHLLERKKSLDIQIITAQEAMRSKYNGGLSDINPPRITFREATERVSANLRAQKQKDQQVQFQDILEVDVRHVKCQKALYNSRRRGSKASIKRLSPYSSPKMQRRSPTNDESTKFKSINANNSPQRRRKHRRSTSSPFIFSGINQASQLHHISPLTTPTMSSSDVKRKAPAAPYEAFLRRQASVKFSHIPPLMSPQQHHSQQVAQGPNFTDPATGFPHKASKDNETTAAGVVPSATQKSSFLPSKSNQAQLRHPLEKISAASSPVPTHSASGNIIAGASQVPTTASTNTTRPLTTVQERKDLPQHLTRKRSLSDSDIDV